MREPPPSPDTFDTGEAVDPHDVASPLFIVMALPEVPPPQRIAIPIFRNPTRSILLPRIPFHDPLAPSTWNFSYYLRTSSSPAF